VGERMNLLPYGYTYCLGRDNRPIATHIVLH